MNQASNRQFNTAKKLLGTSLFSAALMFGAHGVYNNAFAGSPDFNSIPDVEDQFTNLNQRPDALGFNLHHGPDPTTCKHFQSVARYQHYSGIPYLFLSRSGNLPNLGFWDFADDFVCWSLNDTPGNLYIVPMNSRDTDGERLRSNRMGLTPPLQNYLTDTTLPDPADATTTVINFDGISGWPRYGHPGGMELVGDVLVIALANHYNPGDPEGLVIFLDVFNPQTPKLLSTFAVNQKIGTVSVAPLPNGHYLMILPNGGHRQLEVYESSTTDLKDPSLTWVQKDLWGSYNNLDAIALGGTEHWPLGNEAHQTRNFVRQGGVDGELYLIGSRNTWNPTINFGLDENYIDLYRVTLENWDTPDAEFRITWIETKNMPSIPVNGGFDQLAHLRAAGGVYISPSQELIYYGCDHENSGPADTVTCAEWRDQAIVRPNSPSYDPTAPTSGWFDIDEGSSGTIAGRGYAPSTKPWIQLYDDPTPSTHSFALVIDYLDWDRENYDDFAQLGRFSTTYPDPRDPTYPNPIVFNWDNRISSLRWFAPQGCSITLYDAPNLDVSEGTLVLYGTGEAETWTEAELGEEWSGRISSMEFSDCDAYYLAEPSIDWDLDIDGFYETAGENVAFFATDVDGPVEIEVPFSATHPDDDRIGYGHAKVRVNNVPPLSQVDDVLNAEPTDPSIPSDIQYDYLAITNLEVLLQATFIDQGAQDTQTAELNWDDGTATPDSDFETFSDAFGGVTGHIEAAHVYRQDRIYTVELAVTDDDGGEGIRTVQIKVITGNVALELMTIGLESLLTPASPMDIVNLVQDTVSELDTMSPLLYTDMVAAVAMAESVLGSIDRSEAATGGDLNSQKRVYVLAVHSVAQWMLDQTQAGLSSPTAEQEAELESIQQQIVSGEKQRRIGNLKQAVREFVLAVERCAAL